MSRYGSVSLNPQLCDKCMSCVRVCPRRAIEGAGGFVVVDSSRCDGCAKCVAACGRNALVFRRGGKAPAAPRVKSGVSNRWRPVHEAEATPKREEPRAQETPEGPKPVPVDTGGEQERKSLPSVAGSLTDDRPFSASWSTAETLVVLVGLLALFGVRMSAWNSEWMTQTVPMGAVPLMRAGVLVLYYALQLAMLAALGFRKGVGFSEAFGLNKVHLAAFGAVVGMFFFTRLFQIGFGTAVTLVGWKDPAGATSNLTSYFGRDSVGLALTLVMVVFVGPFFEELVFRGVLLNHLMPRTGAVGAIILSSALFAAYHFNAWAFAPVMVMGIAAGWLATSRRSMWPAYALHASYNAIAVVLAFTLAGR